MAANGADAHEGPDSASSTTQSAPNSEELAMEADPVANQQAEHHIARNQARGRPCGPPRPSPVLSTQEMAVDTAPAGTSPTTPPPVVIRNTPPRLERRSRSPRHVPGDSETACSQAAPRGTSLQSPRAWECGGRRGVI